VSLPAALGVERPGVLWALALALPLVLLHLYRRRRVVVAHLPLLVDALGPRRPAGGWQRLAETGSLLARLLALLLVVLALAGLKPVEAAPEPVSLVLVLDADATTAAVEPDGRPRLLHALDLASAWALAAPWAEVVAIGARERPEVWVARTVDREGASAGLSERAEGRPAAAAGRGDLAAALALAFETARTAERARVLVLTAREVEAVEPPQGATVEALGIGTARDDQGLVDLAIRRPRGAPTAAVEARVRDESGGARRALVVSVGGEERLRVDPVPFEDGEARVTAEVAVPREGAWLTVALEGPDAFPRNDAAEAWLAPVQRPSVLVVHGGRVRPYTWAVLDALGEDVDLAASGVVLAADLPRADLLDVVLVDGVALPPGSVRPGAWVFLAPLAGDLPFDVSAPLAEPLVWRSEPEHPLVADLDLGSAFVPRAYPVSGEGVVSLAEADGNAVLAEGARGGARYVVLGLDPEGSDLPVRAALPLLLRNAIRRLAAEPSTPFRPFYRPGEPLRPSVPLPGGPGAVVAFGEREVPAHLDPEGAAFPVPEGPGARVEVRTTGEGGFRARTAFADLDPARSVRPVREEAPLPPPWRAPAQGEDPWRARLLVGALLLLLLDLALLARGARTAPAAIAAPGRGQR
jgi:hypothetical protein